MKIVLIKHGLGNQMFEYAFALALKRRWPWQRVLIDTHLYGTYDCHNGYELDKIFNLSLRPARRLEVMLLTRYCRTFSEWLAYRRQKPHRKSELIEHRYGNFYPNALNRKRPCYFDGYWQSSYYFDSCRQQILQEFAFPPFTDDANKAAAAQLDADNSVIIHVRRGDYLGKTQYNGICPPEYYQQALLLARQQLGNLNIFVISNDIPWCQQHLTPMAQGDPITFLDHNHGQESFRDMQLMTHARCLIIANSSFSWWGAYLNTRPNKIVFAPQVWFISSNTIHPPQESSWNLL